MAVHSVGNGVSAPQLTWKREPEYTDQARRARISGSVLLDAIISAEGIPTAVSVRRGLSEDLDQRAVEAVKSWRFRPASKGGKPVAVRTTIETHFRLTSAPHMPQRVEEPQSAEDAYRYGVRFARERKLAAAAPMFSQAIAMKPDWPQAWAARARIAYQDKRYVDSIKDLDEALRLDPTNPVWYDARGLAYSYSGQHARAIEDYNRAIELSSMAPASYYNNRGWALNETGHPEKAIADLTRALNIEPGYQVAYENRALASYRLKEYGRAIADYSAALQINPTKWQYEKRAEAKRAAGDFTGADEDIRKAAEFRESPPPP
jgi:TonB family protein